MTVPLRSTNQKRAVIRAVSLALLGVWSCICAYYCYLQHVIPDVQPLQRYIGWPLLAFGLAGIAVLALPILSNRRLGPAMAALSTEKLHPGDEFLVRYRRDARAPLDVRRFALHLIFRETAVDEAESVTGVQERDIPIDAAVFSARIMRPGERLEARHTLRIPLDAMHSFRAKHNLLRWFVQVQIEVAGMSDILDEYEITVDPIGA